MKSGLPLVTKDPTALSNPGVLALFPPRLYPHGDLFIPDLLLDDCVPHFFTVRASVW